MKRRNLPAIITVVVAGMFLSGGLAVAAEPRGYTARPCGFDMDRNGVIGDANDRNVGDGVTADPDGDGVNEDILYVDSAAGSDTTGDGSAGNPYKTIQKALDMADGPGDGAEDIICISGTFRENLTLDTSGVAGYYTRDGFQFPDNPTMIIGWDKDNDGEYPPYDTDDVAVLDGQKTLDWAMECIYPAKVSYLEIAHLTIRNYGNASSDCGAMKLFSAGSAVQTHIYVHDVEFYDINKDEPDSSAKIVFSFWNGPRRHVAFMNNLVDEWSSYFCRGAPQDTSGYFRFQNNTFNMHQVSGEGFVTVWKLWGRHNNVEILDNILNVNAAAWNPDGSVTGLAICQGTQDWVVRNNMFIDCGVTLQPFASGYYQGRRLDNILIDRNIFLATYSGWDGAPQFIKILGYVDANVEESVEDVTITNNFFSGTTGYHAAINAGVGNRSAPQPGTVIIAGNTMYGPFDYNTIWGWWNGAGIRIIPNTGLAYIQQNYVIKNNIIANVGNAKNVEVSYAPTGFVANGNVYDPDRPFRWNETQHWVTIPFSTWKTSTGQDAGSTLGDPMFVDAPNNLHLDPNDTVARGAGVDISSITDHDFDGDTRDANTLTAGADVDTASPDTESPTITAWYSAVQHGRGVGDAMLAIPDDGAFSEPRFGGINKLIVEFSEAMDPVSFSAGVEIAGLDANGAPVNLSGVVIAATLTVGDMAGEITFTPALPDYARYIVRISGVTDAAGNPVAGDNDRIITALIGDVSSDLRVNATDFSSVRSVRTKLVNPGDANQVRADVSCDGRVNATDLSRIRPHRGNDATGIADPTLP